jgi:hypothetical protein
MGSTMSLEIAPALADGYTVLGLHSKYYVSMGSADWIVESYDGPGAIPYHHHQAQAPCFMSYLISHSSYLVTHIWNIVSRLL